MLLSSWHVVVILLQCWVEVEMLSHLKSGHIVRVVSTNSINLKTFISGKGEIGLLQSFIITLLYQIQLSLQVSAPRPPGGIRSCSPLALFAHIAHTATEPRVTPDRDELKTQT